MPLEAIVPLLRLVCHCTTIVVLGGKLPTADIRATAVGDVGVAFQLGVDRRAATSRRRWVIVCIADSGGEEVAIVQGAEQV